MTSERKLSGDPKYKQVLFPWVNGPEKYTTCRIGHDDYIHTRVWAGVRDKRLVIDGYKCRSCGTGINLSVHHIRYPEVWGEESMDDLITLCDKCHEMVHNNLL